jgi:hypothetical protein
MVMKMSTTLDGAPRWRSIRFALGAGGSVFALLVIQGGLSFALQMLGGDWPEAQLAMDMIGGLGQEIGRTYLPLAAGVVASLWIVAPLASGLSLARVMVRAVVASAIGAVFVAVVLVASRLGSLPEGGGLMSQIRFSGPSAEATMNLFSVAIGSAAGEFLSAAPLVAVVAIVAWSRLPKRSSTHVLFGRAEQV